MKRFEHILGYIPHNSSDETVLRWGGELAKLAKSASVEFVICYEDLYADLQNSDDSWEAFSKSVVEDLTRRAAQYFEDNNYTISVLKMSPTKGVLESLSSGKYDLMILPQNTTYGLSFVEKVVRKSPVGVLVLPEGANPSFRSILLGVDFSDLSTLSLEWAEAFAASCEGDKKLYALHVISVPRHSKALQATDPNMLRSRHLSVSTTQLNEFLREHSPHSERWTPVISEHPLAGVQTLVEAEERKCDLIVIGSHGRNALSVALLGGQTSDIIRGADVPVLVARRKNESLEFLRQLLGLSN